MKTIAFVPIKLNSQRLPHKNILPIAGRPMCWHIVNSLLQVKGIDDIYVYCSDAAVMQYLPQGAIFKQRDKALDMDMVKGFEIYKSFISEVESDVYVLAHTTSPFMKVSSIENALQRVCLGKNDSAFSAERIQTFAWYKGMPINYDIGNVLRTQDIEPVWIETSAFYIFKKEVFTLQKRRIGTNPYIQEVSGMEAIDIDEREDYEMALRYCETNGLNIQNYTGGMMADL